MVPRMRNSTTIARHAASAAVDATTTGSRDDRGGAAAAVFAEFAVTSCADVSLRGVADAIGRSDVF
jgi:hypothetical protein